MTSSCLNLFYDSKNQRRNVSICHNRR